MITQIKHLVGSFIKDCDTFYFYGKNHPIHKAANKHYAQNKRFLVSAIGNYIKSTSGYEVAKSGIERIIADWKYIVGSGIMMGGAELGANLSTNELIKGNSSIISVFAGILTFVSGKTITGLVQSSEFKRPTNLETVKAIQTNEKQY